MGGGRRDGKWQEYREGGGDGDGGGSNRGRNQNRELKMVRREKGRGVSGRITNSTR